MYRLKPPRWPSASFLLRSPGSAFAPQDSQSARLWVRPIQILPLYIPPPWGHARRCLFSLGCLSVRALTRPLCPLDFCEGRSSFCTCRFRFPHPSFGAWRRFTVPLPLGFLLVCRRVRWAVAPSSFAAWDHSFSFSFGRLFEIEYFLAIGNDRLILPSLLQ